MRRIRASGMRKLQREIFSGFQIGPILAGTLIAAGIETLVAGLSWPFASWVVAVVNYVIRAARFGVVGPGPISVTPILVVYTVVTGFMIFLCGFWLGAWLRRG
jgi:hypothetical protein